MNLSEEVKKEWQKKDCLYCYWLKQTIGDYEKFYLQYLNRQIELAKLCLEIVKLLQEELDGFKPNSAKNTAVKPLFNWN